MSDEAIPEVNAPAPNADAPVAPPVPDAPPAPQPSALEAGKAVDPTLDAPKPISERIPEKFRVNKEDGTLDLEASLSKVEEHRSHLEKRLGAGDIPPKTADEYKLNIPEKLAEQFKAEDFKDDPMLKSFMADAHAAGLTQKQMDMVMSNYLERLPQIGEAHAQASADECTAQLKEAWKSDTEYKTNLKSAYDAAKAFGGNDFDAILKDYGNDARVVKMLAAVGKELGEDRPASSVSNISEQDASALVKGEAYWNPQHPEHEATKAKVNAYYAKQFGDKPKSSGSMAFGSVG